MKITKNTNLIYLIYLPIFANFLYNFYQKIINDNFIKINYYDLTSSLFLFLFLFFTGKSLRKILDLPFVSTGISTYLLSFFIFDIVSLFFYRNLTFDQIFLIVNTLWLLLIIFRQKNLKLFLNIFFSYSLLKFFNFMYFDKLTKNKNIIGDVEYILLKHIKNIYEQSYFFSMNNPSVDGYPQLTAYVQAVFHKLLINMSNFEFLVPGSKIIFFLLILLFFELNLGKESRFLASLVFATIIYNSEWLKFLFIDSLMTEGVLAYLFATLLLSLTNERNKKSLGISISFFLFGMLFIAKQFISTISIFVIAFFLIKREKRIYALFGLLGLIIKELSYVSYFENLVKNHHLKELNITDAFLDLLLFRNLKFENIFIIVKNIYLDKPIFIILVFFLTTLVLYLLNFRANDFELTLIGVALILNIALVFALYIGYWKNMELESPIRFLLYMLPLYIYFQFKVIDNFIYLVNRKNLN